MKKHIKEFLRTHSLDDIKQTIEGELNEFSTIEASFWFGNGELIVCTENEESVYVIDHVRGFDELIEY